MLIWVKVGAAIAPSSIATASSRTSISTIFHGTRFWYFSVTNAVGMRWVFYMEEKIGKLYIEILLRHFISFKVKNNLSYNYITYFFEGKRKQRLKQKRDKEKTKQSK